MLTQKRPLTDLFNHIEDVSLDLSVPKSILNQDYLVDLYEKAQQFLKLDNQNRHYKDLLAHLKTIPNPSLRDIIEYISRKENKQNFDDLKDLINQKDKRDRFLRLMDFIHENNNQGIFNDLLQYLDELENPRITDILKFATKNNQDGRYDPILARIIGRKINLKNLQDLLNKFNHGNKYDKIIKYLQDNPTTSIDKLIEELEKDNKDGKYNVLIRYIYGEGDDFVPSDQDNIKFLEDLINTGDYPEVRDQIKNQKKNDPYRLKTWLEKNNQDDKYNPFLKTIKEYLENSKGQGANKLSIPEAHKHKLRECLNKLRLFNRNKYHELLKNKDKMVRLFNNMFKDQKNLKARILNSLRNFKNEQATKEQERLMNFRKHLLKLINAQNSKMVSAMIKLHQNSAYEQEKQKNHEKILNKAFGFANSKLDMKKYQVLDALRNFNRVQRDIAEGSAKNLRDNYLKKMKDALDKLRELNRSEKERENIHKRVLNKKLGSSYQDLMKKMLNALRDHKNE